MKKFAIKLLLFVGVFFVFDKVFILVANRSAEAEADKRLEYLVRGEIKKDIIIMGSSRGARDIIAKQIEDQTGFSAYNLCYPGSNVEYHEFILRTLVKFNTPPKIVLLVIDDNTEFLAREDVGIIFRKDRLYPLVKYKYIRQELHVLGEKDLLLSNLFVLSWLNKSNFDLREKKFSPNDTLWECGSMPISWQRGDINWRNIPGERLYPKVEEIPEKVEAYRKIVELCNSLDIQLVIVFPPSYKEHSKLFENRIRQLTGNHADFYIYNTGNPAYRNKDYFSDDTHLIRKGAEIFTNEVITYLLELPINCLAN